MLDEVYPRIPTLKNGTSEVNAKLNINPTVHQDYLTTCEAVSTFLENGSGPEAIQKLNNAMLAILDKRIKANSDNLSVDIILSRQEDIELFKLLITGALSKTREERSESMRLLLPNLLADTLSENELSLGFSLGRRGERNQAVTFLGFIDPDTFRAQLGKGRQWKDPTVPGGHGEFTHRIQWYMITQNVTAPQRGWRKFYEWVGQWKHAQGVSSDPPDKANFWLKLGLWDALVDRNKSDRDNANGPYNTDDEKDFRSPENLHPHLISDDNKANWLLHAFLKARDKDRAPMLEADQAGFTQQAILAQGQYLARKLYGVPLEQLDEKRAQVIAYHILGIWNPYPILEPGEIAERKQQNATTGKAWFENKLAELRRKKLSGATDKDLNLELVLLESVIAVDDALIL